MSNDLGNTAVRLAEVLARENDALRRLDFSAAVALVPDKEAALTGLARLVASPRTMEVSPALGQRLGGLAFENQMLLERAIAVQTRIVRIVARAGAPSHVGTRYSAPGGRAPSHRAAPAALSTRV
ncbi:MAG: hypothetical protein P4L90_18725 [Rhodopila sp.]|nr:hypothetical protein [Rhodopila sp.]